MDVPLYDPEKPLRAELLCFSFVVQRRLYIFRGILELHCPKSRLRRMRAGSHGLLHLQLQLVVQLGVRLLPELIPAARVPLGPAFLNDAGDHYAFQPRALALNYNVASASQLFYVRYTDDTHLQGDYELVVSVERVP